MGLLDDAIREHLELKRLRGADPGVVAREEQDALGSGIHGESEAKHGVEEDSEKVSPDADRSFFPAPETASADSSAAGQETVEINMEAELATEPDSEHAEEPMPPERDAPMVHPEHSPATTEESLEWEVPSDHREERVTGMGPDDERDPHVSEGESVEDVLEETPDFLRDTPEQERLWFEQRPPRDFDFNE
jgi:hypothetical protein